MLVRHIGLQNFIPYEDAEIDLPDRGIVFITGPNGSGKSAIIDAVSVAVWNNTLRGPLGWRDEHSCGIDLTADGETIHRRRTAGGTLKFEVDGGADYGAAVKAKEFIESHFQDFDTWRKTSVFLSEEAGMFTRASDGDRKRFIESLINIDFEGARKKCSKDRADVEARIAEASKEQAILQERMTQQKQRVRELEKQVAAEKPAVAPDDSKLADANKELTDVDFLIQECRDDRDAAQSSREEGIAESGKLRADRDHLRKRVDTLDRSNCPTCDQPIPESIRDAIKNDWHALEQEAKDRLAAIAQQIQDADATLDEFKQELRTLTQRREALIGKIAGLKREREEQQRAKERADRVEADLEAARTRVVDTTGEQEEVAADLKDLAVELAELLASEAVLGLRGFRAHVLDTTLQGVETLTNLWLERLAGPDVQISLKPATEKDDGSAVDRVALDLTGWGSGRGYKALSQGQKRRVDLAIMLAFADFVAGVRGCEPGTLWFDEVCDTLDKAGIAAVAVVLREIAEKRPIVLISHSDELYDAIGPDRRVQVTGDWPNVPATLAA